MTQYSIRNEQATSLFVDAAWASKPERQGCAGTPETLSHQGTNTPQR